MRVEEMFALILGKIEDMSNNIECVKEGLKNVKEEALEMPSKLNKDPMLNNNLWEVS